MEENKLHIEDSKGKVTGTLTFNLFDMDMRPSLISYLKSGWNIKCSFGIDFTLSNLEPNDNRSLHKQFENDDMNEYEKAIYEVGNVITPYLQNKMFAAYGFGGVPEYAGINEISSCWNLNG